MFGIGSTELLVILVVALIVLGPKSLAKVSRTLGKAMGEFRRVSTDFQRTLNAEAAEEERRERREAVARAAKEAKEARDAKEADNVTGATAVTSRMMGTAIPSPHPHSSQPTERQHPEEASWAPDTSSEKPKAACAVTPPAGSPLEAALAQTHALAQAAQGQTTSSPSVPTRPNVALSSDNGGMA